MKPTAAQRGPPQLRESEEELAAQGDHLHTIPPGTLGALIRGGRGAPVSPEHFEEELKEKVFSFDSDRTVCAGLYRGVAEPLLAAVKELNSSGTSRGGRRRTGGAPGRRARVLHDDELRDAFAHEYGRGRCGDGGVRRRARQRRGARTRLGRRTSSSKATTSATTRATWATRSATSGAAPRGRGRARALNLQINKFGDEGARRLGDAASLRAARRTRRAAGRSRRSSSNSAKTLWRRRQRQRRERRRQASGAGRAQAGETRFSTTRIL